MAGNKNDLQEYGRILERIHAEVMPLVGVGQVASYIPALAAISPDRFGMVLETVGGERHVVGDTAEAFSVQSIAKVFALSLALRLVGDDLWQRVGREPSGTSFDSMAQLEQEAGIPRNPMINAGALVVIDAILSHDPAGFDSLLDYTRELTGDPAIDRDEEVARAEEATGSRNRALAHYLASCDNLDNAPDEVLGAYFRLCALSMTAEQLATGFRFLANGGLSPAGQRVASLDHVKRLNAVMLTCGVYDEAGDFAYRVGLPVKSGVGGGMVAVLPGQFVASVWSPALSPRGNSVAGGKALELLTTYTRQSIF